MFQLIMTYSKPYRREGILAILCVAVECIFELVVPVIMADLVDVGVANGDRAYIISRALLMGVCALMALGLGIGGAHLAAACGQGLGAELRAAEYRRIQAFSFGNSDRFQTASLVTRLTSDVTAIQNAVSAGLRPAVRAPIMLLTALLMSFRMSTRLATVFLVAAPTLAVLLVAIIRAVRPMYGKMQEAADLVNRIVQENLAAIRVVKAYVRGEHEAEKFDEVNTTLQTTTERAFRLATLNAPAMQAVMYGTILAILWFGGNLAIAGDLKVGVLTGFLSYVLQVLNALMMLSGVFLMLTRSMASFQRVKAVMDEVPEIREEPGVTDPTARVERGEVTFDHVSFRYYAAAKELALTDITLHIRAGQTVGILGGTGSAKSTLVQLIPRLYDVTEGAVKVGGRDVRDYDLETLRNQVSMVLQNNILFSGTIKENLRWGNPNATDEQLREACVLAQADDFISLFPDGYDTYIEQGGTNVSGGQKQRLCIARALLKKPKILILDDSTSAVDTQTDANIRKAFQTYIPETTKIIIAQRIASVQDADRIILLDNGMVAAVGNHEELLRTSEIYREVFQSQNKAGGVK